MNDPIKIDCPSCKAVRTITIVGRVGSNVSSTGKLYETGVAVTSCAKCDYMMQTEKEVEEMLQKRLSETGDTRRVAIGVDAHKATTYIKELSENNFTVEGTFPYKGVITFYVTISHTRVEELKRLCKKLELHFKSAN